MDTFTYNGGRNFTPGIAVIKPDGGRLGVQLGTRPADVVLEENESRPGHSDEGTVSAASLTRLGAKRPRWFLTAPEAEEKRRIIVHVTTPDVAEVSGSPRIIRGSVGALVVIGAGDMVSAGSQQLSVGDDGLLVLGAPTDATSTLTASAATGSSDAIDGTLASNTSAATNSSPAGAGTEWSAAQLLADLDNLLTRLGDRYPEEADDLETIALMLGETGERIRAAEAVANTASADGVTSDPNAVPAVAEVAPAGAVPPADLGAAADPLSAAQHDGGSATGAQATAEPGPDRLPSAERRLADELEEAMNDDDSAA